MQHAQHKIKNEVEFNLENKYEFNLEINKNLKL